MEIVVAERDRGRAKCESDIAKGRLQLYWGTRAAWGDYMTTLMDERFGVQVVHTSDITNAELISFQTGYDECMSEYINTTFGDGSFETALADVDAFRKRRYREHFGGKDQ